MESYTKSTFTPETLAALAKVQFGSGVQVKEIIPLTEGYFNTAYAIHFTNFKPNAVIRINALKTNLRCGKIMSE